MKIALIGYGKMGREIETILRERGHEVALIIDMDNAAELDAAHLQGIDVALEFTTPATASASGWTAASSRAIVAAVAHSEYLEMALPKLLGKLTPGGVFSDVKSSYNPAALLEAGVRLWRL